MNSLACRGPKRRGGRSAPPARKGVQMSEKRNTRPGFGSRGGYIALAMCMVIEWLNQQLETTENTKMQYTGSDFKMTSQANHMAKLKVLINDKERDCLYLQRLYKRRKVAEDGSIRSTISDIVSKPSYGVEPADCNNLSFLSFVNQR